MKLMIFSFLFFSLILFWQSNYFGFCILLLFTINYLIYSFFSHKKIKLEKRKQERKKLFDSLTVPKIRVIKEGYSTIFSLTVPSPELFNEIKSYDK